MRTVRMLFSMHKCKKGMNLLMRLDKFLSDTGKLSRKEASSAIKRGRVTVDSITLRDPSKHIDPENTSVTLDGEPIVFKRFTYILLEKPEGYISSTEQGGHTVMKLLPLEFSKKGLFPCGRLDRDTTGVLLITDDGDMAHMLLSPKRHVSKIYRFTLSVPAPIDTEERFLAGITIGDEECAPATVIFDDGRKSGEINLTEGKFHQVKRMFTAVGTEVVTLRRIKFGPLTEDLSLDTGKWRELTKDEVSALADAAGLKR